MLILVLQGIYDAHISLKKVPFLEDKPEYFMRNITAYQAASKKVRPPTECSDRSGRLPRECFSR